MIFHFIQFTFVLFWETKYLFRYKYIHTFYDVLILLDSKIISMNVLIVVPLKLYLALSLNSFSTFYHDNIFLFTTFSISWWRYHHLNTYHNKHVNYSLIMHDLLFMMSLNVYFRFPLCRIASALHFRKSFLPKNSWTLAMICKQLSYWEKQAES